MVAAARLLPGPSRAARLWIALALAWPGAAHAVTSNTLLGWCERHLEQAAGTAESAADTSAGAACLSYLAGVVDTVTVGRSWDQWHINICVPDNARTAQIVKIYTAWAIRNPDSLYQPAPFAVARALHEAFPCR